MLLFTVREIRSPIGDEFRGYRMALAIPNESGFMGNPSFIGKWLVAESSDYTNYPSLAEVGNFLRTYAREEKIQPSDSFVEAVATGVCA